VDDFPNNQRTNVWLTAAAMLGLTLWILSPSLDTLGTHIIGDAKTDAIRGSWGLQHLFQTLSHFELPWDSNRVNFPVGARLLVLPLASGILLAPLGVLGATLAWNLTIICLVATSGFAVAWLTRTLTDRWLPGLLSGAVVISQPMFHHAIVDGTAEHIALWAVPAFIGTAWLALSEQSPRWGVIAGFLSIVVALDSPYHGIYALVLGLTILPFALKTVRGRERDLGTAMASMVVAGGIGVAFIVYLYGQFDGSNADAPNVAKLQQSNATDLRLWWHYIGSTSILRDSTRPPTLIPTGILIGTMLLCLFGKKRSLPWLVVGLLMIGFSFGLESRTPANLTAWVGEPLGWVGSIAIGLNEWLYTLPVVGDIRFPRRWLVPAAMTLSIGAGIGLSTVFSRWIRPTWIQAVVVGSLSIIVVMNGLKTSRLHTEFPKHKLPSVEFTKVINEDPISGGVLLLPAVRSVTAGATREQLPIFANLHPNLASADDLFLQTQHHRPMVSFPSLQTLAAAEQDPNVSRLLRDWSDLSHPKTSRRAIPPSAIDPGAQVERSKGLKTLRAAGLRWIAVDLGAYEAQGIQYLIDQLGNTIFSQESFDEGDGVLLITVRQLTSGSAAKQQPAKSD
jgi:hypothetical protein